MTRRKEKNMDPSKYVSNYCPPVHPPETSPKEFCSGVSKKQWGLARQFPCLESCLPFHSTSPVCPGKLQFTHQNPTQLSSVPRNVYSLSNIRQSKSRPSQQFFCQFLHSVNNGWPPTKSPTLFKGTRDDDNEQDTQKSWQSPNTWLLSKEYKIR